MSEGAKRSVVIAALLVLVVAGILFFNAHLLPWALLCWVLAIMLAAYLFGPALKEALEVTLGKLAEALRSLADAIGNAAKAIVDWAKDFVRKNGITASNADDVMKGVIVTAVVFGIDWFLTHVTIQAILVDAMGFEESRASLFSQVAAFMCVILAFAAGDFMFVEARAAEPTPDSTERPPEQLNGSAVVEAKAAEDTPDRPRRTLNWFVVGLCLLVVVCAVQVGLGWWRAANIEGRGTVVQFLVWGLVPVALSIVVALYALRLAQGLVLTLAAIIYQLVLGIYGVRWVLCLLSALVTAVKRILLAIHTVLEALPRYALSEFGIVPLRSDGEHPDK